MSRMTWSILDIAREISERKNSQSIENWKGSMSGLDWQRMRSDIAKRVEPIDWATQAVLGGSTVTTTVRNIEEMMHSNKLEDFLNPSIISLNSGLDMQKFIKNHSDAYEGHLEVSKAVAGILDPKFNFNKFLNKNSYEKSFGYTPIDIISGATFLNLFSAAQSQDSKFDDSNYLELAKEAEEQLKDEAFKNEIINLFEELKTKITTENIKHREEVIQAINGIERRLEGRKFTKFMIWIFEVIIIGLLLIEYDHKMYDKNSSGDNFGSDSENVDELILEYPTDIFSEMKTSSSSYCAPKGTRFRIIEQFVGWKQIEYRKDGEYVIGWVQKIEI